MFSTCRNCKGEGTHERQILVPDNRERAESKLKQSSVGTWPYAYSGAVLTCRPQCYHHRCAMQQCAVRRAARRRLALGMQHQEDTLLAAANVHCVQRHPSARERGTLVCGGDGDGEEGVPGKLLGYETAAVWFRMRRCGQHPPQRDPRAHHPPLNTTQHGSHDTTRAMIPTTICLLS